MEEKQLVVVLADGFEELEALAPIDMLRRAGAHVTVAGLGKKIIVSSHRVTFVCDAVFETVSDRNWDGIILPGGGKGSELLSQSASVVTTAIRLFAEGKLVAAICAAPPVVLGASGILEQRHVTCFPGAEKHAPSIVFDHSLRVIRDGNLITSQGAGTALDFAMEIVGYLYGPETESMLKERVVY